MLSQLETLKRGTELSEDRNTLEVDEQKMIDQRLKITVTRFTQWVKSGSGFEFKSYMPLNCREPFIAQFKSMLSSIDYSVEFEDEQVKIKALRRK